MSSRLALGTVQFGLPYGIADQYGQVSRDEVAAILQHAWAAGIDTLDTAIAYGESEQKLGEIGVDHWQVISKLPPVLEPSTNAADWVQESVVASLRRLRISKLYGLLLHCSQQLLGPQGNAIYQALQTLKQQGLVAKIGVSVYGPDELDALCPHYQFDLVQAPFSIVDQRLANSGWMKRLHQAGIEIHIRSVFLQGLLLMDVAKRPASFNRWQPLWKEWHRWLDDQMVTPLQACLGFVLSQSEVDHIIVGVNSLEQSRGIFAAVESPTIVPPNTFINEDPDLIDPSRWNTL